MDNPIAEILKHHKNYICSTVKRRIAMGGDASDVKQEVYIRLIEAARTYRGESSLRTWLYSVVTNACVDEIRKRVRDRRVLLISDANVEIASCAHDPLRILESREMSETILSQLDAMPDPHKALLVFRYLQDLSYKEIGHIIGCDAGIVKSRLQRARKRFRRQVEQALGLAPLS